MLTVLDGIKKIVIYIDVFINGLECVVMQYGRVIVYASRQLKNYELICLELGIVVFALKIWRHYSYGEKIQLYIDDRSLKYLITQKEVSIRR